MFSNATACIALKFHALADFINIGSTDANIFKIIDDFFGFIAKFDGIFITTSIIIGCTFANGDMGFTSGSFHAGFFLGDFFHCFELCHIDRIGVIITCTEIDDFTLDGVATNRQCPYIVGGFGIG